MTSGRGHGAATPNIVNVGYDATNCYVLNAARASLLVDAGWPSTLPDLRYAMKRTDVDLGDIRYLLCTHYHPDHAGLAQELKALGVTLVVLENQYQGIEALRTYMKPEHHYHPITRQGNLDLESIASRAFLLGLGIQGEILLTPGHSDDSVSLVLDGGLAFTGDLPPPGFTVDPDHPVRKSWGLLRAHNVHTAYPGHGPARHLDPRLD
jgi:glyoxylase-like metal-dependent hydrolase (beta-lactamase superfamily II)